MQNINKKILIVEDEQITAMGIEALLKKIGYTSLEIVNSGEEAISIIESFQPNLILMDITLNGKLDGIETGHSIHKFYEVPIIFITAHDDNETFQRAKDLSPSNFIIKPIQSINDIRPSIELAFHNFESQIDLKNSKKKLERIKELIVTDETQSNLVTKELSSMKIIDQKTSSHEMGFSDPNYLVSKFEALANEDRFFIFEVLRHKTLNLTDIQNLIGKSQSTSSHHIKKLETENIIQGWKQGKFTFYSIIKEEIQQLLNQWSAWIS